MKNCIMSQRHWSLIVTCPTNTLLGFCKDPIVYAITNKQLQMLGALLGLPKAPKALLLQRTKVKKKNDGNREIVMDFWYFFNDIKRYMKGIKRP
jgi:hypothetical protein